MNADKELVEDRRSDRNLVPDEETALTIGVAILNAYYGKELVDRHVPYRAVLMRDSWAVMGTSSADVEVEALRQNLRPGSVVIAVGGGAPEMEISRKDSRVVSLALAR
jgi:hypothetical protein